jgi:predicted TIM-barrel fold metal-dependent hydrolase
MIRIDSDTHFTPLDAFADLDPKYAEQGPRVVALVVKRVGSSRLMIGSDYSHPDGTSPNTVSMLQARQGLTKQDVDNILGGTAAEFFGLKQYL